MKRLLAAALVAGSFAASPSAAADKWGVIIYAKNLPYSDEIRRHEIGHVACPKWRHPRGLNNGKDWKPPRGCDQAALRRRGVELIEQPVSKREALARCRGQLGCSTSPEIVSSLEIGG